MRPITQLKGQSGNAKIVCYLSAGTWESWRPDQNKFPEHLKKENYYSGSSREKWLDITKWGELKSIMQSRMSMAKSKGCDAIEFVCVPYAPPARKQRHSH
jgi:hypothetical protein